MREKTFKRQFIVVFVKILVFSFILSLICFFIWYKSFNYIRFPANFYENQVKNILEKIDENYEKVLDKDFQESLKEIVPIEGILYQVVDMDGNIVYGTFDEKIIKDKQEVITNINSTIKVGGNSYARISPILDENSNLKGAIVLQYNIKSTQKTDSDILFVLSNIMLVLPFVFIIIFTIIYAKKLSKEINKPLKMLLDASNKIKNHNLDFTIQYNENNEFSKLCNAFEDMRVNLKNSLIKQWDLEEKRRENIANIAHDLKTPLTIVGTYTEALLDGIIKKEKTNEYLEVIKRNNSRALVLLKDLNNVSNIENPNFSLKPIKVNIVEFIKSKEKDYKLLCEKKGIDFKLCVEDLRREKIEGKFDIKSLEQVLDNCISNSIRYTGKGDSIIINTVCKDDVVEFSVVDTGKGFSQEDLKNIFNKFYKGDKSRSFTSGHSGLGMYIAKTIVEKHGGSIKAERNTPKGAIIKFNIQSLE